MKLLSLVLLAVLAAAAQDEPNPQALLTRSGGPLIAARSAKVTGTLVVEMEATGLQQKIQNSFSLAFAKPGRYRSEFTGGPLEGLKVSDGTKLWSYSPATKTYTESAAPAAVPMPGDLENIIFGRDPTRIKSAALEPGQQLQWGGRQVSCYVVRAEYTGMPAFTTARNAVRLVWIDREHDLVLRDSWEATMTLPPYTVPIRVREVIDYSTIEWDQPMADDLFAFHPPEGSSALKAFTPPVATALRQFTPPIMEPPSGQMIPSNGSGSGGGIGSGAGGGIGSSPGGGVGGGAYRVGGGVTPPVVISKREPEYTEKARKAKYQGSVVLSLVVGVDGVPRDFKVLRPLGMGLDEKAIEAVSKWRFRPGTKDGKPVPVLANIEVSFKLL